MNQFSKPIIFLQEQLAGIRPGSLSIGFVETFRYEGKPLRQLASVTSVKDRIHVIPFDRSHVNGIAKALVEGKLNAYAMNPTTVCVPIPPISGEQKEEMSKHIRKLGEDAKIAVRQIRHAARKTADDKMDKTIQKETDKAVAEIENMVKEKIKSL